MNDDLRAARAQRSMPSLPALVLQHIASCLHDQLPDDEQRRALAGQMSDIMTPEDGADFREMCE